MSCIIDSGRLDVSCRGSIGGLKNLYILSQFDSSIQASLNADTFTAGVLTSTSIVADVYKFELLADANTFTEENQVDRANGTSVFVPNGSFTFKKQDALSQELFEKLVLKMD